MAKVFLAAMLLVANTIAFCPSTTKRPIHTSLLFFSSRPANDFTSPDKFQSPPSLPDSLSIVSEDEGNETTSPFTASSFASTQNEDRHTPFQIGVRATCLLATASYIINPEPLDDITSSLYSCIKDWEPASNPLFEAQVAVMGFFIPIIFFSCLHLFLGKQKTMQSRFDGKLPTRPFEWLELENLNLSFNPVASYLLSIWIYHQFVHPHAALPELAPTFGVFAIELIFGVWLYDCLFFPLHWLMHKSKFGRIRKCHGYHHRVTSHSLNALETVQHSYMDGFLQVAVNILVQQITPFGAFGHKHFLSRLAHNIVVTYLLTEAHSGYDLPWMSHRIFPEILGGAPRHEAHHHDGRVYYQQYFKWLDDLFGFTEDDIRRIRSPTLANKRKEHQAKEGGLVNENFKG